jgi:hypothetical protein
MAGAKPLIGTAFGSPWPYLRLADRVVSPAVPVPVEASETQGPDGAYRLQGESVLREAVGVEASMLDLAGPGRESTHPAATGPHAPFDMLWFGEAERYIVAGGLLQVEDLFCRLRAPVQHEALERLLVRTMRLPPDALHGLQLARPESNVAPTIEVQRPLQLMGVSRWWEPHTFLRARTGVDAVVIEGSDDRLLLITLTDGRQILVSVTRRRESRGWSARPAAPQRTAPAPFAEISVSEEQQHLVFRIALPETLDPLSAGLRGRLAFDMIADLVALRRRCEEGTIAP